MTKIYVYDVCDEQITAMNVVNVDLDNKWAEDEKGQIIDLEDKMIWNEDDEKWS